MFIKRFVLTALFCLNLSAPINAHELWLEGEDYQIEQNDRLISNIKVGEDFKGSSHSYFPSGFERFDIALGDDVKPVEGRIGDRPAVNIEPLGEGLNILIHQSDISNVFYTEWEKFVAFIEHKAFEGALDQHKANNFPQTKFRELYSRYAKSLVAVGNGEGQDRAYGLETEIIALENPYTDDMSDGIDIKVVYQDQPRANAQVEVFERLPDPEAEVNVFTAQTNAEGVATIKVKPGYLYQLDAVVLRMPDPSIVTRENTIWETLWANTTFLVPAS